MASKANRLKVEVEEEEWEEVDGPKEKESSKEKKEPREKKPKKLKGMKARIHAFRNFLADERTHKISALLLILMSFFMVIAFTSNLFTWREDQAVAGATSAWDLLFNNSLQVENWLGKLGAVLALQFVNNWFGIASFVFPLLIFLAGIRILFDTWLLPIGKTIKYSLFTLVWLPTFLAYCLHSSNLLAFGGGYGYHISQTLQGALGFIGAGALLVFSMTGFLVVALIFHSCGNKMRKPKKCLNPV